MSLFKRMSNLIRSNVNDALDSAEDPKKILDQTIMDMQGEHQKAKKMLLETLTLAKQAEKQASGYVSKSSEWEQKAMAALKGGKEDLARQALEEKQKMDDLIAESNSGVEAQKAMTEELKRNLEALEAKIEEAKGKRDELLARLNAAEMKKKQAAIHSGEGAGASSVTDSSAFDTFDRMVEKIENKEAEVEAHQELSGISPEAQQELNELDTLSKASSADDMLAQLKAKMNADSGGTEAPAAAAEPAAADPKASAIEDELAALRAKLDD